MDQLDHFAVELADCAPGDTSGLKVLHQRYGGGDRFLRRLLDCCESAPLAEQASWLLKRHLESGAVAGHRDVLRILGLLDTLSSWTSQLHVLQSIRHLNIPHPARHQCLRTLRTFVRHKRNFVRAWAYDALAALADQHPDCRDTAMQLIHDALDDEAPSVQARLRNILKIR